MLVVVCLGVDMSISILSWSLLKMMEEDLSLDNSHALFTSHLFIKITLGTTFSHIL
jgi:hypothetical protein